MQQPPNLRERLGLSQDEMASYLGIKRVHVAMLESYQRSGSTHVLLKKARLEIEIERKNSRVSAFATQEMEKQAKKDGDAINKLKKKCLYLCTVQERKLVRVKKTYEQALLLLQVVAGLRENEEALQADHNLSAWLDMAELGALQKLKANSPAQQQILKMKIKSYQLQCQELSGMML